MADNFLLLSFPCEDVAADSQLHDLTETVCFKWQGVVAAPIGS